MRSLFIDSLGMFTCVGTTVEETVGALYVRRAGFHELAYLAAGGQPVIGAPTRIASDIADGADRILAMGSFALAECARGHEREPTPLVLACPRPGDLALDFDALVRGIEETTHVAIDRPRSRAVHGEHAGIVPALELADRLLQSGSAPFCYVGGVDCLIDAERIGRLLAAERIKGDDAPDGFIPGEAAVFLRVTRRPQGKTPVRITGLGGGEELATRGSGKPNTARGLTAAMRAAMKDAEITIREIGLLANALTGEHYDFVEMAIAGERLRPDPKQEWHDWMATPSVGETGAAAGALTLAYLAFLMPRNGFRWACRHVLYAGSSEDQFRGAAVVSLG